MRKKAIILISIMTLGFCLGLYADLTVNNIITRNPNTTREPFIGNLKTSSISWSHSKVISDNVNDTINWNTGDSGYPAIDVDISKNVHVAWRDTTNLEGCGTDGDIFYANYSAATGKWSHSKVISDNVNGTIDWNTGESFNPAIAVDRSGNVHVAWEDFTNLEGCGADLDIFYANYSAATGNWSHAKVISDNINGTINWNIRESRDSAIAVDDSGNIHVAWCDWTNLEGCSIADADIFYANYSVATLNWSHAKVISDNVNGTINWNTGDSLNPAIAVDDFGNVTIAWGDNTNLEGCSTDYDIFCANYSVTTGKWAHAKVISDNVNGTINWNTGVSYTPVIAVDDPGNVHVAWRDETNLEGCGTDSDIFYANYSVATLNWSHSKVISDNVNGTINWNTGDSLNPAIAVDDFGNVHVAWQDWTNLEGCSNAESDIFYTSYSAATRQWSHAKVISDNVNGTINWNIGVSRDSAIAVDGSANVHVAWQDYTNLEGCGTDGEIFYAKGIFSEVGGGLYLLPDGNDDDDDDDEELDIIVIIVVISIVSAVAVAVVIVVLIKKSVIGGSKLSRSGGT